MLSTLDKEIWRIFRMRGARPKTSGLRIALLGNCQVMGLGYAMSLLLPSAQVDPFQMVPGSWVPFRALKAFFRNYDLVFMHDFSAGLLREGNSDALRAYLGITKTIPFVHFAAFHPDQVYVHERVPGEPHLGSPTGHYHSALALFGFLHGLSPALTEALFQNSVLEFLGYFRMWDSSISAFQQEMNRCGIDIAGDLLRWTRRGVFMHSFNHPKFLVLFDIAKHLLSREGIVIHEAGTDHLFTDFLGRAEKFPIYPDVARRIGERRGGYLFSNGEYLFDKAKFRAFTLSEFIEGSHARYGTAGADRIICPRVEAWCADRSIVEALTSSA